MRFIGIPNAHHGGQVSAENRLGDGVPSHADDQGAGTPRFQRSERTGAELNRLDLTRFTFAQNSAQIAAYLL